MIRHLLAPTCAPYAEALGIARTLELPAGGGAATDGPAARVGRGGPGEAAADPPAVAITFDDGPHPRGTPEILDILARHGAHATFFVVGEQVLQRPQLLVRMLDEGHAIALHGFHHRLHLRCTPHQIEDDFTRGIAAVQDAVGVSVSRHRPPYGIYSPWSLRTARERGLKPLLWSAWGKDWRRYTTPERIAANATCRARTPPVGRRQSLRAGDVILLHDADFYSADGSHEKTARALPNVLTRLQSGGFDTVVSV